MKKTLLILTAIAGFAMATPSCKNKKNETKTEQGTNSSVQVNTDEQLRSDVNQVVKDYNEVTADIKDGVVTLRGSVKQEDLQKIIMKIQELKPRKVDNQLVIKTS